jgi:hypothetical protein
VLAASLASEKTLTLPTSDMDLGSLGTGGKDISYYRTLSSLTSPLARTHPAGGVIVGTQVSLTTTAGRHIALPFWAPRGGTIDKIYSQVTTAVGGQNIRMGIYANNSDTSPNPTTRLFDSGSISAAATGIKSATVSLVLTAGSLYWLTFMSSNAGIVISSVSSSNVFGILGYNNTDLSASQSGVGLYIDGAFGALPDPFGTAGLTIYGSSVGNMPLITVDFSA